MSNRLGFWLIHFNIAAVCLVLLGAFGVQFVHGELPCPLCVLQRMGMLLCVLGQVYILLKSRDGDVPVDEFARGFGMSLLGAVAGAAVSTRQILLHIVPPDPGFGEPMFGLHLYTWALVVFITVIVVSAIALIFARELTPRGVRYGMVSKLAVGLFAAIVAANGVSVFFEEGFHLTLPDDPARYQLLYDLGKR